MDAGAQGSEDLLSSIKALSQSSSTISQQQALGSLASTQASSYNQESQKQSFMDSILESTLTGKMTTETLHGGRQRHLNSYE